MEQQDPRLTARKAEAPGEIEEEVAETGDHSDSLALGGFAACNA